MQYAYTHWFHGQSCGRPHVRRARAQAIRPYKRNYILSGTFLLLEGVVPEKSYAFHSKKYDVFCCGKNLVFDPSSTIQVNAVFARAYPRLLKQSKSFTKGEKAVYTNVVSIHTTQPYYLAY